VRGAETSACIVCIVPSGQAVLLELERQPVRGFCHRGQRWTCGWDCCCAKSRSKRRHTQACDCSAAKFDCPRPDWLGSRASCCRLTRARPHLLLHFRVLGALPGSHLEIGHLLFSPPPTQGSHRTHSCSLCSLRSKSNRSRRPRQPCTMQSAKHHAKASCGKAGAHHRYPAAQWAGPAPGCCASEACLACRSSIDSAAQRRPARCVHRAAAGSGVHDQQQTQQQHQQQAQQQLHQQLQQQQQQRQADEGCLQRQPPLPGAARRTALLAAAGVCAAAPCWLSPAAWAEELQLESAARTAPEVDTTITDKVLGLMRTARAPARRPCPQHPAPASSVNARALAGGQRLDPGTQRRRVGCRCT